MKVLAITADGQQKTTLRKATALDDSGQFEESQRILNRFNKLGKSAKQAKADDYNAMVLRLVNEAMQAHQLKVTQAVTEALNAKVAKSRRKAVILKSDANMDIANAKRRYEYKLANLLQRLDVVDANAAKAQAQMARQQARKGRAVAPSPQDWVAKADQTQDPNLREAYKSLAVGESNANEDD